MSTSQPLWPRVTRKLKRVVWYPLDRFDLAVGNRPPDRLIFVGDGSWRAVGHEFLHLFRSLGFLKPDHQVLEVGSGIGRMAAPLTRFLEGRGSYSGFDIVKTGVEWCQKNISSRYPNFTFLHSDILNAHYNPSGTVRAAEYVFPFRDGSFDFVFLTSVFTHMAPPDVENYLSEISRVMRPGARCLITFFLINSDSDTGIRLGLSALPFTRLSRVSHTAFPHDPEAAIAFDEDYVRSLFEARGLVIDAPIRYGSWSGRKKYLSYQDVMVGVKGQTGH